MSLCSHGVPRLYHCPDSDHENHRHHKCDEPVRMADLDLAERRIILALIEAGKQAALAPSQPR